MARGIFITFEGSEGCGKSSHIKSLAEYFKSAGKSCVVTREPGGTPLSERIRNILLHASDGEKISPKAEILLFAAARAQHVEELIKPALGRRKYSYFRQILRFDFRLPGCSAQSRQR